MDGQTLQQLFAGSNPFLAQMGEKAFNQAQQKEQANLASIMGAEQRNQAMHPLEMESKRQAARMSGGQADIYADQLARKIPVEEERKAALQASIAKMDSTSRAQMKEQVVRNMQLAAMMEKNGGQLPQGFNLSPEEMQVFTPKNLKNIIAHGQAFMEMDPEWIAQRKKAQEAERLAQVRGQVQMDVKGTPSAGGSSNAAPTMDNAGIVAQLSKLKEARQKLAALKTILPQLTEEQQAQWQGPYLALKKQAEEELRARTAGDVDIAATTKGKVPVTPSVNLGDAPGAVASRPQRQAPAQVSQADIEFTAKKHGISVEEVKKRLGIK